MKKYSYAVYIGRFQPFHNGHLSIVQQALEVANKLIIIVGSANRPRTIKDPFSAQERILMMQAAIHSPDVIYHSMEDSAYDDTRWLANIQNIVYNSVEDCEDSKICMIGYSKDETSYYLNMFPQWKEVRLKEAYLHEGEVLSATQVREAFIQGENIEKMVPLAIAKWVNRFKEEHPEVFANLQEEFNFIKNYKKQWSVAPYPPVFVTADAVVMHSGHILMVKRKAAPGKGLWALPGGFVNQTERILDACLRELREETGLKLSEIILRRNIKARDVFDNPNRSLRGRTITHAFFISFETGELPRVRGQDDAEKAKWIPLAQVLKMGEEIFEDHLDIIKKMM